MWILKSRRSRTRVLYSLTLLLGTTIVAGTSMLGSSLSSLHGSPSSRTGGEHIAALALLEVMDEAGQPPTAFDDASDPTPVRSAEHPPSAAMIVSAGPSEALEPDDEPQTTADARPADLPGNDDSDTSSDLPEEQEEYAGTPGTPPAGLHPPRPAAPDSSSPPIAALPPVSATPAGPVPGRSPQSVPSAPPIVIGATPPAAPRVPTGPAPQAPTYRPPVVVMGGPAGSPSATPPAAPNTAPVSNDPLAATPSAPGSSGTPAPGPTGADPVIAANPTGEASGPTDAWYSPGSSPGIDRLSEFTLGGQTLIIEFVSSEPGLGFDVLQVEGTANLDYGNIVFAFLNDYQPDENVMYEFLQARDIVWGDVDLYYGVLDGGHTEDGSHAPRDWSLYSQILDESIFRIVADDRDGRSQSIHGEEFLYHASLALDVVAWQTLAGHRGDPQVEPDPNPISNATSPGAVNTVPSPDVLNLLLSGGLGLLLVTFIAKRRQRGKGRDHDNPVC